MRWRPPWLPEQELQSAVVPQGSYKCGACKPGFLGNQTSGCFPRKSCDALTFNPCDSNAHCTNERNGEVACRVSGQLLGEAKSWCVCVCVYCFSS